MAEHGLMGETRVLPGSNSLPPIQLSAQLTLDLLHIKEPSLEKPSHMHRKIQGRREEGRWEDRGGQRRATTLLRHTEVSFKTNGFQLFFCLTWQDLGQGQGEKQEIAKEQCAKRLPNQFLS